MTIPIPTVAVIAGIVDSLGGMAQTTAAGIAAALAGLVVSVGTAAMLWHLISALISNPTWQNVKKAVGGVLVAVFVAGATPGLVGAVYNAGKNFGNEAQNGGATAAVGVDQ